MLTIGLTGNIGAGKSTVAELLVAHGAALVDADKVAREVVEPGAPAYQPLVDRFGTEELEALNAIIHPAIGVAMIEGKDAHAGTDRIVVMDIPLLKEFHRELLALDAVVVVDVPPELALERLTTLRDMSEDDARARQAAQPTRAERLEGADFVVDNSAGTEQLAAEVDRVWAALEALPAKAAIGAPDEVPPEG
jgi:dephospho-CoA kinase